MVDGAEPTDPSAWMCERFDSCLAHPDFFSTLIGRQVVEKWRRCGGSIEPISVVRDSFREEQLLQPLLVRPRRGGRSARASAPRGAYRVAVRSSSRRCDEKTCLTVRQVERRERSSASGG